MFLPDRMITYAQVPDVGPGVCAWKKANGERCDESIEYCEQGCPLRIPSDTTPASNTIPQSNHGTTNNTLTWVTLAATAGFLATLLVVTIISGNVAGIALVASGIAIISFSAYGMVKNILPNNKENTSVVTSVAGEWKGRYTITAPPECAGEESAWGNSLTNGDPEDLSWNAGGITFHGKVKGNTMEGFFSGPPCGFNADNEPVSGTFFGGRIVPIK